MAGKSHLQDYLEYFRFKIEMIPVLAACSAVGLVFYLATGHAV